MKLFKMRGLLGTTTICLLAACAGAPDKPLVPDGSSRIPVNRLSRTTDRPAPKVDGGAPVSPQKTQASRPTLTLDAKTADGQSVRVSLLATLDKIARNTGLRLQDNGFDDQILSIVPSDDPFDVLRQLAGLTRYRITLIRTTGRLVLSDDPRMQGVVVERESHPVQQIGSPVALAKMPQKPIPLIEALRLLAPADFDVGHAEDIEPNIRVDLSAATTWLDGLERVALQTPYRVVFDWNKKLVYAMPVAGKQRGN